MEWTREEIEAIVVDYLHMLTLELSGQAYSKADHRRRLLPLLNNRSEASIEFKHGNISAVLAKLGIPGIRGYLARENYQKLLAEVVEERFRKLSPVDAAASAAVQLPATAPSHVDFSKVLPVAPKVSRRAQETEEYFASEGVKRDYLAQESRNASLGLAGEQFVLEFEHWRLIRSGAPRLADKVEHVSVNKGDGLGYDILSFDESGRERFIEVKTTTFNKETPFFVSRGELGFSKAFSDQFHLYRLFEFRASPKLFELPGALNDHCILDPVTYQASFS